MGFCNSVGQDFQRSNSSQYMLLMMQMWLKMFKMLTTQQENIVQQGLAPQNKALNLPQPAIVGTHSRKPLASNQDNQPYLLDRTDRAYGRASVIQSISQMQYWSVITLLNSTKQAVMNVMQQSTERVREKQKLKAPTKARLGKLRPITRYSGFYSASDQQFRQRSQKKTDFEWRLSLLVR